MRSKVQVGIAFCGRSAEHEVSLISAQGVMGAVEKGKHPSHDDTNRHPRNRSAGLRIAYTYGRLDAGRPPNGCRQEHLEGAGR